MTAREVGGADTAVARLQEPVAGAQAQVVLRLHAGQALVAVGQQTGLGVVVLDGAHEGVLAEPWCDAQGLLLIAATTKGLGGLGDLG